MNELEKLESVYADARKAYAVAREAYKVAKGTHIVSCDSTTADDEYQTAYDDAWDVANYAAMAINSYRNKMKTENKMNELKAAAVATRDARMNAYTAYSDACLATDAAWDTYLAASIAARDADNAANDYAAYAADCAYLAGDK